MKRLKIAILGTVGVPGNYGGFETLAENLVRYHERNDENAKLTVYCSARAYSVRSPRFGLAKLRYLPLDANGAQSILYDVLSLFDAVLRRHDRLLLLGVSGALALPLVRLVSGARIVTNIDGIEWKRAKWNGLARAILRVSEWCAVRFSHEVIADNQAIADYVATKYGRQSTVIAYGGEHALAAEPDAHAAVSLPASYALALCRIEPENNVAMILEAWQKLAIPLVFVGNWERSSYGRALRAKYSSHQHITMLDPIFEPSSLRAIRQHANMYIHGHSSGGTNPSLVEMMFFGIPIIAHGCTFNKHTTETKARYFMNINELVDEVRSSNETSSRTIGGAMREIAGRRYTWDVIGAQYFDVMRSPPGCNSN